MVCTAESASITSKHHRTVEITVGDHRIRGGGSGKPLYIVGELTVSPARTVRLLVNTTVFYTVRTITIQNSSSLSAAE